MKKNLHFIIAIGLCALSFTTASLLKDPNAPTGKTGAPKQGTTSGASSCRSCHGDFSNNSAGGSIVVTGLPTTTYTAGMVYNFSIKINHGAPNILNWGFAIKAVNTVDNNVVGSFTTTNPNASLKGTIAQNTQELSNGGAGAPVTASGANTYTFNNLTWTAPASPGVNETNIRFYVTALAGDNDGGENGDYVYTTILNATYTTVPVNISSFKTSLTNANSVTVLWNTQQEINTSYFEVQKSNDGINWLLASSIKAKGNTNNINTYTYSDNVASSTGTVIFYRIKTVDVDGTERFSAISSVNINNKAMSVICKSAVPLKSGSIAKYDIVSDKMQDLNISTVDMNGKIIYKALHKVFAGTNSIQIPVPGVNGVYTLKVSTKNYEKVITQIVQ